MTTSDTPDTETDLTSAISQLTAAVNQQPDVRVMALSGGTPTDAYVANPTYWPSLRLLAEADVPFAPTTARGGWEVVQWTDLATTHPADILLYDQRPNSLNDDQLATIPAWSELPTRQVLPWNPEPSLTYETAAAFATTLATTIGQMR